MALLFETFNDIKPYVSGANTNNAIETLDGYIATAVDDFIKPVIGDALWAEMETAYAENDLTAAQQQLLPYLQRPLAHFAYYLYACDGGLIVDDAGIGTHESGNSKVPYKWQVLSYKKTRLANAWSAVNTLLKYLWEHKTDFDSWVDAEERIDLWRGIVWDVNKWNKIRAIDGYGTLWALKAYTKAAVETDITAELGDDFAEEILTWLEDGTTDADLEALRPMLERCVVFKSIYRAAHDLPLEITAKGIYINEVDSTVQNEETSKVALDKLSRLTTTCDAEYQLSLTKLKKHLDSTASLTKYTTYFNSDKYNINADSGTPSDELYTGKTFSF